MNSDPLTPDTAAPAGAATEETTAPRRRSSRRSASAALESATPTDTAAAAPETPTRTRRRRTAATPATTAPDDEAPATSASPRRSRSRSTPSPEAPPTAPAVDEVILPLNAGDTLVAEGAGGDELAAEGALTRPRRRRRGRGGRGSAAEEAPESADTAATALLDEEPEPLLAALAEDEAVEIHEDMAAEATTGTGRRRRRRGRGGRGAEGVVETADEAAISADEGAEDDEVLSAGLAEPGLATPEPTDESLSTAVLRRFDHRDWRDRPTRPAAQARAAVAAPSESRETLPFRRPERGSRSFDRPAPAAYARPEPSGDLAPRPMPGATTAPAVTPSPIVTPPQAVPSTAQAPQAAPVATAAVAPPSPIVLPHSEPAPGQGGSLEERLERLLAGQATLLQQQQQALASLTATMASLQETIQHMTTTGIAAGMPRAGVFVDAPNVVYAAENARVAIDYGRMLDFLGRGREMVHAIVYAPVTEEAGYRFEGQRFVAPFLQKGYKLVTKPLKRFPDGTAKGNFDIELAIDIVTMSQRLDVVILISGDSDFSRLIELIQSRGVRVEVAAFASNVSWELVQMADVFIDIGQYLHEFRAQ